MKYRINGTITIEGGEPEMPIAIWTVLEGNWRFSEMEQPNRFTAEFDLPALATTTPSAQVAIIGEDKNGQPMWNNPRHQTLDPKQWRQESGIMVYDLGVDLTWEEVEQWGPEVVKEQWAGPFAGFLGATYRITGKVTTELNGVTVGLPMAKVEIIEYDPARRKTFAEQPGVVYPTFVNPPQSERRDTIGTVETDENGNFEFEYDWYPFFQLPGTIEDKEPDIILRVTQQSDGHSVLLAETEPRMSTEISSRWDITVPSDNVPFLCRPSGTWPTGILQSIGFLPADKTRIDNEGYATSQTGDFVSCTKAPFFGVLDIYARFNDPQRTGPKITHYRMAYANESGQWTDIDDQFFNFRRDSNRIWRRVNLGPNKVGGVANLYECIELQSPNDWLFDELKLRWNSGRLANGKYTLRLEGYSLDSTTGTASPVTNCRQDFVIRLDNTFPTAKLLGIKQNSQKVGECSIVKLLKKTEQLEVEIDVRDHEGHLEAWSLSTTYGRDRNAGARFAHGDTYKGSDVFWGGPGRMVLELAKKVNLEWPRSCAYSFVLCAIGRGTNGRGSKQRAWSRERVYIQLP